MRITKFDVKMTKFGGFCIEIAMIRVVKLYYNLMSGGIELLNPNRKWNIGSQGQLRKLDT